jgi:hypothetical protein
VTHAVQQESEAVAEAAPAAAAPARLPASAQTALALQRAAGNRAVLALLGRSARPQPAVARCPSCGGTRGERKPAPLPDDVTFEQAVVSMGPLPASAERLLGCTRSPGASVQRAMVQRAPWISPGSGTGIAGAAICAYPFFSYALDNFPSKSDKWKHCWVSCKIQAYCGDAAGTALVGAGKEVVDWICDQFGGGCKAEWADFVADVNGIMCGNDWFRSCASCCDSST